MIQFGSRIPKKKKPVARRVAGFFVRNQKRARQRPCLPILKRIEGPRKMGMVEAPQNSDKGTWTNRRPQVRAIGEL